MPEKRSALLVRIGNQSNILIMVGIVVILAVMLIPMPAFIIDFLLVINFMIAFIMLLSPLYLLKPTEFSVYPGLLLFVTLYRRFALSRTIAKKFIANDGVVYGITLEPALEQMIIDTVMQIKQKNYAASLSPEIVSMLYADLKEASDQMIKAGLVPVIIVQPNARAYLRRLIEPAIQSLPVVAFNEIPTSIPLQSFLSVSIK